jgi:putative serine protease PepD
VRLSPPSSPSGDYLGSGSIISADGLVLTNAHVARPTAPGLAALYGARDRRQLDPERVVVSTTEGDGPAKPSYLADVLAIDGHLDLAVLRINALADGGPLPAGLTFPFVELGSVAELELGDDLTVYGFPGLNGGDRLTVRTGIVSSFLPDTSGRVAGNRYRLETSADFSGGNSGGMALSNDGRLVGVPSATKVEKEELDEAHYVRPVDLAAPLIAAARAGTEYRSPYLVAATGRESATDLGWASKNTCSGEGSDVVEPGGTACSDSYPEGMAPRRTSARARDAGGVDGWWARWYDQTGHA